MQNLEVQTPADDAMVEFSMLERPQRVFFMQRRDANGDVMEDQPIVAMTEQEAASVIKFHKIVGVGDGQIYFKTMQEAGLKKGDMITRRKAKELLQSAFDAELAAARGHIVWPQYNSVTFDDSIKRHRNAGEIMKGFNPPN